MQVLPSADQVAKRLQDLLANGFTLESALRHAHRVDGIGLLVLCKPVELITGLAPDEAKKLLVRAVNSE